MVCNRDFLSDDDDDDENNNDDRDDDKYDYDNGDNSNNNGKATTTIQNTETTTKEPTKNYHFLLTFRILFILLIPSLFNRLKGPKKIQNVNFFPKGGS